MPHSAPHSHHSKPIRQCVATRKGGPFQIITTDYPEPGPDEICIRNRAVGLNPVDLINLDEVMESDKKYPIVLGTDVAGVVEAVGSRVTTFKVGDAVMATCDGHHGGEKGGKYAAFQDITTVPATQACRKPVSWTFAEAASAPTAYLTACLALSCVLHVPLPHLLPRPHPQTPNTDPSSEYITALRPPSPPRRRPIPPQPALTAVLVLGGTSALGAAAIQLLRLSLPEGTPIISTNPAAHKAWVTGVLGATTCVDGRDTACKELVAAVRALTPGGEGVDGVLDAVGEFEGDHMDPDLWGVMMDKELPEGAPSRVYSCGPEAATWQTSEDILGKTIFLKALPLPEAMRGLGELVDEGRYKLPLEVEVVGKGLEGVAGGLEKLRAGVSGKVLVVSL